jgi:phage terminase large subunit GpA-like protein
MLIKARVSRETAEAKRRNLSLLRPGVRLKISEWAKRHRILSRKDSARSGRWRSDPHQDQIMNAFCDPTVWKIVLMAASQIVGKSQMMNNVIGYYIDVEPTNVMAVFPTVGDAEKWSKGRLDPLIETTKRLQGKIRPRQSRDSANTIFHRQFRGGQMFIVGSNAPSGLSAQSVRLMIADEVDRYEASAGEEGDPLELAEQRTETYWNRKIAHVSSPLIAGLSRIEASYAESDQRIWECRCPHCSEFFEVEFEDIEWDKDECQTGRARHLTDTAHVVCRKCGVPWSEGDRQKAIGDGRWRPTAEFTGIAGFRINAFSCKRSNLARLAARWIRAKGNPEREKAFVNLVCAKTYQQVGEAPEQDRLYERRERYKRGIVPRRGLILTAGVDAQRDRLEVEIVAWGRGLESWSVDYRVFHGDPARDDVWRQLDAVLGETFRHESGSEYRIACLAIDSGFETHRVYDWCRRKHDNRIMLVKGFDRLPQILGRPSWVEVNALGKVIKRGVQVWPIGVSFLKSELYSWLRLPMPAGDGSACYCHFPQYDREHFEQLAAEQLVTKTVKGYPRREWQKIRGRNEALDCRIYARAAAAHLGLDNWTERRWAELEALVTAQKTKAPPAGQPAARPRQTDWLDRGGRGGWLNRGGRGGWLR